MKKMKVDVVEKSGVKYVEGRGSETRIENEGDVVELLRLCGENLASRLLLHAENLTEEFFDLRSGQAGMILQKFVNYHVKVALLLSRRHVKGRFGEMVLEANRGRHFRAFYDKAEAELWLISD
jgi:PadR family transcriptional regulator AphA